MSLCGVVDRGSKSGAGFFFFFLPWVLWVCLDCCTHRLNFSFFCRAALCCCLLIGNTTIRHCGLCVVICVVYIVLEVDWVLM